MKQTIRYALEHFLKNRPKRQRPAPGFPRGVVRQRMRRKSSSPQGTPETPDNH